MLRAIVRFFGKESQGQDLAEYCLITALVALVGLAIFIYASGGVQNIWNAANSQLIVSNATQGGGTSH